MENVKLCYDNFGSPCDALRMEKEHIKTHLEDDKVIVKMLEVPINPSDLIPVTGAYKHRITLPQVAGYEGVGEIILAGAKKKHWLGKRVLPLRKQGTWQKFIKSNPKWFVEVPANIKTSIAARAYINPLTAKIMLTKWPVYNKNVLITAAGSFFSTFMIQWAVKAGANKVIGVYRNPKHIASISGLGATPIALNSINEIIAEASDTDICFDAVGGSLADTMLKNIRAGTSFVSYGLLSGAQISYTNTKAKLEQFHLRHWLQDTNTAEWDTHFDEIWNLLVDTYIPDVDYFDFQDWPAAIKESKTSGRRRKSVLRFE